MAPDVQFNAGYGVEAALENWRLVSLHHEHLEVDLERVERGAEGSVIAHMNGITTSTVKMLRMAFPNYNDNDEEEKQGPIAEKLLGQRLVVPSGISFRFDDTNTRVVGAHYEADMMTPLLRLLRSVEDTSRVLSSALDIHHWSNDDNQESLDSRLATGAD